MYTPTATYRIQLHKSFTLQQLSEQIDYLHDLGISTIYASPIFQARPGSSHGYDVTNPERVNADMGTEDEFIATAEQLKKKGMGWLQDIVPNHMAYDTVNPWIDDLLEKGPASPYAAYFDVNWEYDDDRYRGKIMAPFLGSPPEEVVNDRQLTLNLSERGLRLHYYDHQFPLSVASYPTVLRVLTTSSSDADAIQALQPWIERIEAFTAQASSEIDNTVWPDLKSGLHHVAQQYASVTSFIETYHQDTERMTHLLDEQNFRLVHWQTTEREINYRRFFTVNDLICLNIHHPDVFAHYHRQLLRWVAEGYVQGVRIDHIDGLMNPTGYLRQLRQEVGNETYVVVEKILEHDESLPSDWPIQGESGYRFLAEVNQLFTRPRGGESLLSYYPTWEPPSVDYEALVYQNKHLILHERMRGELDNLMSLLTELDLLPGESRAEPNALREAVGHLLVAFPVYRIYSTSFPFSKQDRAVLDRAWARAQAHAPERAEAFTQLQKVFSGEASENEDYDQRRLRFVMRFQQFAGPLAAKGVEDTTFYQYFPLIAHNEVGDSPERLGTEPATFHQEMQTRAPHALNATATHDTKRGEDARRRISMLSELPSEWMKETTRWRYANEPYKTSIDEHGGWPTANFEYFIYQTLVGTYPFHASPTEENYEVRLKDYLLKAAREAKRDTSWSAPNEDYERAIDRFVTQILRDQDFMDEFVGFAEPLARQAVTYSLGQTLLKVTAPGVPDVYQGTEYWDLSMVDPDNRRPVDYRQRQNALRTLDASADTDSIRLIRQLCGNLLDPSIKLFLLSRALRTRRARPELFAQGAYQPVEATGALANHLLAFRRVGSAQEALVVVPLNVAGQSLTDDLPLGETSWSDTELVLPDGPAFSWTNVFTQQTLTADNTVRVSEVLRDFPVALLINRPS